MTQELIKEIHAERHRQNMMHPVPFVRLLPDGDIPADHMMKLARYRSVNNQLEARGEHDAMYVALEELYEFFTAETKEEQLKEAVQNIAFWVRIHEYIISNRTGRNHLSDLRSTAQERSVHHRVYKDA